MSDKVLTIGAATYDDFEGVFFTFQALRLANLERLDSLDLVVIDNNPTSSEGKYSLFPRTDETNDRNSRPNLSRSLGALGNVD